MVERRFPPNDRTRELRTLLAQGRFHDVVEAYRELVAGALGLRARPSAVIALLAATAATRMGNLELGATLAMEALEEFRVHPDDDSRMRAVNLLGAISFERGDLAEAQDRFDEALRLAQELDDHLMMARTANNLASVAHLRGEVPDALRLYRTALLGYQRIGDRHFIAETYHNFGVAFRQEEDWVSARNAAVQAIQHAEMIGEPSLLALVLSGQAEIDLERGELELSAHGLDRAARLTMEAGDDLGKAEVRRLRASLALRRGDAETARREADVALEMATRLGSLLLQAESAATLARALKQLGRFPEADDRRQTAIGGFRRLGAVGLLARFEREWAG